MDYQWAGEGCQPEKQFEKQFGLGNLSLETVVCLWGGVISHEPSRGKVELIQPDALRF